MHSHRYFQNMFLSFLILLVLVSGTLSQSPEKFDKTYEVRTDEVLFVRLEVDAAEVDLYRSQDNSEVRVRFYYDEEEFKVYSNYDRKRSRLEIEFDKRSWVHGDNHDLDADLVIELPTNVEVDFKAKIKAGDVNLDLGGLSLVGFELTTWAGEVDVDFSEPNKSVIEYLKINTKIGETTISKLGNARFRDAEINGGIGEMSIDLRGENLPEASADIDLDIGETEIVLPDNVGVKLSVSKFMFFSEIDLPRGFSKSGRYYYSRNYDKANAALDIRVSPGLGDFAFTKYPEEKV